ncbi:hypothetical protein N7454_005208 [Penicillium verhagenii]|nr:hypothetical protein N7454_005208 [Penicillium verhagenii]
MYHLLSGSKAPAESSGGAVASKADRVMLVDAKISPDCMWTCPILAPNVGCVDRDLRHQALLASSASEYLQIFNMNIVYWPDRTNKISDVSSRLDADQYDEDEPREANTLDALQTNEHHSLSAATNGSRVIFPKTISLIAQGLAGGYAFCVNPMVYVVNVSRFGLSHNADSGRDAEQTRE